MYKDPFHIEETPYDILRLPINASKIEVKSALVNYMKNFKKTGNMQKAMAADKKIKNTASRLTIDIMYYSLGQPKESAIYDPHDLIDELDKLSAIVSDKYYTDLDKSDFESDFTEISERKIILKELKRMDDIQNEKIDTGILIIDN